MVGLKMSLFKKKRPRGRPPEYEYKITTKISSTGLPNSKRKKKPKPLTKRQRSIGRAVVEGGGLGFVVGGTVAGLGGMVIGFPIGAVAGRIYGSKKAGKKRGRKPKKVKK